LDKYRSSFTAEEPRTVQCEA